MTLDTPASVELWQERLSAHQYIAERSLATAIYLAVKLKKPLFVEGEAGVGKTEIAKVLSQVLARPLIRLQCYEGLDVSSALYEWNYAGQILQIRMWEAAGQLAGGDNCAGGQHAIKDIFTPDFLLQRPLLQAVSQADGRAPVLLIDELDRADEEFEAFLLGTVGRIPGDGARARHHPRARAARCGDHVEPHARDSRCAETALSVPLD